MVVVGGNVLHHVKREGELSGRGKCPGEYARGEIFLAAVSGSVRVKNKS